MKKLLFRLFALCAFAVSPLAASADLVPSMEADMADIMKILEKDPANPSQAELKAVLERRFSFYAVSRRALGRGWNRFSEAQQEEFVNLFTDLLVGTYASRYSTEAAEGVQVRWSAPVDLGSGRVELASEVTVNRETVAVVYRLAPFEGELKIYDVLVEGISLVSNYREQFSSLLDRGTPEDVLEALRKR